MNSLKMLHTIIIIPITIIIGIIISAYLRKKRYKHKKYKIIFNDFKTSLFFLFALAIMDIIYNSFFNDFLSDYQFGLIFEFLFIISISLAAFIGVFIAIGYKTIELKKNLNY